MRALSAAGLGAAAWIIAAAGPAYAHGGSAIPHGAEWNFAPLVVVPLLASLALFLVGWLRLWRRSAHGAAGLRWRAWWFALGWLVLAAALTSPLHQAGERSFAAHMAEHELLMLAAAPLLVLGEPLAAMLWAFPAEGRRTLAAMSRSRIVATSWRFLVGALPATLIQGCVLWLWHMPSLFDLALRSPGWHAAQHLSFVVSALLFWSAMLHGGRRHRMAVVLCLFATSTVSGALGALMAFAQSPWYEGYARLGMTPYGLTSIQDQQLAGMLMWVPGGLVHALAALGLLSAALRGSPRTEGLAHAGGS